jgi:hypothetical protein
MSVSESRERQERKKWDTWRHRLMPDGIFSLGKTAAAAFLMVVIAAQLLSGRVSGSSWDSVRAAVIAAAGIGTADTAPGTIKPGPEGQTGTGNLPECTEGDARMIRRLYGLDEQTYENAQLYYPSASLGADELFLVRLKTPDQADTVRKAMEARKVAQMKNFEGYAPESYRKASESRIEVSGGFALYVSGDDAERTVEAFRKAL